MSEGRNLRAAAAVIAATAGVGFSSGRETALFFSQMGKTSWFGIFLSSIMFGFFCAAANALAAGNSARSFRELCRRLPRAGKAASALHTLTMTAAAGVMLLHAGRLGELAMPFHNAGGMGAAFAALAALCLAAFGKDALPAAGAATAAACTLFYAALGLDPREVPKPVRYFTVPELSGSAAAAAGFALLHAAMNAVVSADASARAAGQTDPVRFGALCGLGMLIPLSAANAAILSAGKEILSLADPTAALAARWGKAGYYAALTVMAAGVTTTLSAMLSGLADALCGRRRE